MALQISDTTPRIQYTATSGQTSFSVPFEFFAVGDLKVYNGTTLLTYNNSPSSASQYSVTGAGVTGGGSITLGSPGATLNDSITIVRDLAIERLSDFPVSGNFPIQTLNSELDKIVAMLQQLEEQFARTLQYPVTTTTGFDVDLPELVANRVLSVNADATALLANQELGTFKGDWATSTSYQVRDLVKDTSNGNIYFVNAAHTSSGTQPLSSNTNSSKYDLIIDAESATTSATNAATSATAAASSATAAATSATNAATSESNAATSESNASTSETNASTSATNASNSATAAATSATNAATSESNASTSETNAATSASAASSSATAAASSASAASTSETNAATSASNAATSASNAATSESNAATSESNAATSASNASNAQTAAETAQAAAEAIADSIDDTYLGAKASNPTVDNDGDPLTVGDWYFNTTSNQTFIYNGSSWDAIAPDLIGDTTPQLGGDLDLNSNDITGTGNINITGTATVTGLTTTGDINFGDGDRARFGASQDLQIYHTGSKSLIYDSGAGDLEIRATNFLVADSDGTSLIYGQDNGAVYLYHNGSYKLQTTSTGIDVTGTVVSDGLTVDGNFLLGLTTGAASRLTIDGDITHRDNASGDFAINNFENAAITFGTYTGNTGGERMRIDSSGNVLLNNTTSLIGANTSDGSDNKSVMINGGGSASDSRGAYVWAKGNEHSDAGVLQLNAGNVSGAYMRMLTSGSERMRIDSSGNVGIGTSSPSSTQRLTLKGDFSTIESGILFDVGGNQTVVSHASATSPSFVISNKTTNGVLRFDTNSTERMRITSSGNVGIGYSTPDTGLQVNTSSYTYAGTNYDVYALFGTSGGGTRIGYNTVSGSAFIGSTGEYDLDFVTYNGSSWGARMTIGNTGNVGIGTSSPQSELHIDQAAGQITEIRASAATVYTKIIADDVSGFSAIDFSHDLRFKDAGTERMRIDSDGALLVNKTASNQGTVGLQVGGTGANVITQSNGDAFRVNRLSSDGNVVLIMQDTSIEGIISVSGATVTYGGFTGSHWSRLSDNSKPTILRGTILESLDEMCDWYQVQFDITDEDGNTTTQKQSYALGDGESVGDLITYNFEGTDYQATIIQEDDVKHVKAKISDTVDAKNVYGVFSNWDEEDDTVNDMNVAQTGTFVVRMNSAETVSKGDLIQSNGDGTGKVQSDDIIRSSTVAKVLSTTKIETYEDGSYIVPCSLHC